MLQKQGSNGGCIFLLDELTTEVRYMVASASFLHLLQIFRLALFKLALGGAWSVAMLPFDTEQI